jgi:catechol 2,3-dioxygenase-like lactoylglutathione lyase family enzyme
LAQHTVRISDPQRSLAFYQNNLGMNLISQSSHPTRDATEQSFVLGFPQGVSDSPTREAQLELVYRPLEPIRNLSNDPLIKLDYWKIGLTVSDVDVARQSLLAMGADPTRS